MTLWKAILVILAFAIAPHAVAGWCNLAGDLETQTDYSFFRGTVVSVDVPPVEIIQHGDGRVETRGHVTTKFAVTTDYSGIGNTVAVAARYASTGSEDTPPSLTPPKTTSSTCRGDCPRSFELGQSYFVAVHDEGGVLTAGTCAGGVTEDIVAEWARTGRDPVNPVRAACKNSLVEMDQAHADRDTVVEDETCRSELVKLAALSEDTRVTVAGILNPGKCREYRFGRTPDAKAALRACRLSLPVAP